MAHARVREQYFANVRIQWGKQNKHVPGAHNFDPNRGPIKISKERLEELVKQHAGKGQKANMTTPLSPGYNERVEFNEIIGDYALRVDGKPTEFFPTTKGILRYSKDGVHVTPAQP